MAEAESMLFGQMHAAGSKRHSARPVGILRLSSLHTNQRSRLAEQASAPALCFLLLSRRIIQSQRQTAISKERGGRVVLCYFWVERSLALRRPLLAQSSVTTAEVQLEFTLANTTLVSLWWQLVLEAATIEHLCIRHLVNVRTLSYIFTVNNWDHGWKGYLSHVQGCERQLISSKLIVTLGKLL